MDGLKTFEMENWCLLKIQTLIETAKCYEQLEDLERLARTCAQLACAPCLLSNEEKLRFCDQMTSSVEVIGKIHVCNVDSFFHFLLGFLFMIVTRLCNLSHIRGYDKLGKVGKHTSLD